ncbi:hypothetical protein ABH926_006028 [Catenulispora sp. GP43]|uniref:hypothetical protein n=1 Tax=Catenulispora sp. GP43 TaxID=3156263 RepID=UPI0035158017
MSNKNSPSRGHHGLGARGQGKLLYAHTQVTQFVRQAKDQLLRKRHRPHDFRQADGRWTG